MALVDAYNTKTGEKVGQVPAHWIGHPVFGVHLSKTPRQKASEQPVAEPVTLCRDFEDVDQTDYTETPAFGEQESEVTPYA